MDRQAVGLPLAPADGARLLVAAMWALAFDPEQPRDEVGRWTDADFGDTDDTPGFPPTGSPRTADMNSGEAYEKTIDELDTYFEKLLPEEDAALENYTHDGFKSINTLLHERKGALASIDSESDRKLKRDETLRDAWHLQNAITSAPEIDMIVYRNARLDDATLNKMMTVGSEVRFAGITSTSTEAARASRFSGDVMLEIRAKQGMWGNTAEDEVLLAHGARYTVRGLKTINVMADPNSAWAKGGPTKVIQLEQHK